MRKLLVLSFVLSAAARPAVVIDRIAVIVGKHVIKLSDIDRDIRLTDFLNRAALVENADAKHKAADRLIDQQIIREELATGAYSRASDADADALLHEIQQNRYAGSEARLKQVLATYGLTEEQLRTQLVWQMTVLRFIEERFRTGVLVTDDEVRRYYDDHPELKKTGFDTAAPQIRKTLEGEQVNAQFEQWLDSARKEQQIEFRDGSK